MGSDDVVMAATRLFAGLGYDGTSAEMIADAAGVSPADVVAMGGKRGLYEAVMERTFNQQLMLLDEMESTFTPDLAGLHRLFDRFLDFFVEHPEISSLWQQRSLEDAADLPHVEGEYATPMIRTVNDRFLYRIGIDEADLTALVNVLTWTFHGFFTGGVIQPDGTVIGRHEPVAQAQFRYEMHRLIDSLGTPLTG